MEGEIDFDPLSAEEKENVNRLIDENRESLLMKEGETYGRWYNRFSRFLGGRRQAQYGYKRMEEPQGGKVPTRLKPPEEHEMTQIPSDLWVDETLLQMKREGLEKVKEKFPRFNEDKVVFRWGRDEYGRKILQVGLKRKGAQLYTLIDGENKYLRSNLPETLQKLVGNRSLRVQKTTTEDLLKEMNLKLRETRAVFKRGEEMVKKTKSITTKETGSEAEGSSYDQELLDNTGKILEERKEELIEMKSMGEDTTSQEKIIKDLQSELTSLKENEGGLRAKVLRLTNDARDTLKDLDDKTQELEDVKAQFEEAKRAVKDNEENMAAIESLQRMKENAENVVKEYQDKLEEKENQLKLVIHQKNLAADYFDGVSKNVDAELKRLDIKVAEGENKQTTIEHLQGNFELLLRKLSETQRELNSNKEKLAEAEKNNDAPAIIAGLKNKIEDLKQKEVKMVKDMNDLNEVIKQQKLRMGYMFKEMQNTVASFTEAVDVNKQLIKEIALKDEKIRQLQVAVDDYERTIEELHKSLEEEGKTEEEKEAIRKELERLTTARDEKLAELKQEERERGYTTREKIKRLLRRAGIGVVLAGAIAGVVSLIMSILNPVGAAVSSAANTAVKQVKKLGKEVKKIGEEVVKKADDLRKKADEFEKKAEKGMGALGKLITELGKKMAASIPGLLGHVISLILKTGGELLKFVGNNIWILVVALGAVLLKGLTDKR